MTLFSRSSWKRQRMVEAWCHRSHALVRPIHVCANPSFAPFTLCNPWIQLAIHGSSYKEWIHTLLSIVHGLRKSVLCAQHILQPDRSLNFLTVGECTYTAAHSQVAVAILAKSPTLHRRMYSLYDPCFMEGAMVHFTWQNSGWCRLTSMWLFPPDDSMHNSSCESAKCTTGYCMP